MSPCWVEEQGPQFCLHFPNCNEIKQLAHNHNVRHKQKHKQNTEVCNKSFAFRHWSLAALSKGITHIFEMVVS